MATKDYKKDFSDIADSSGAVPVSNGVSRDLNAADRAFDSIVWQSGKPILDSELVVHQDANQWENRLYRKQQINSGWLRGSSREDSYLDFTTESVVGVSDDSGSSLIDGTTLVNSFVLPRLTASVAGRTIVIEYTNTSTADKNLIELPPPPDFSLGMVKRTDFIWLEVWLALVAPSPKAAGAIQVVSAAPADLQVGDTITVNSVTITASLTAGAGLFVIVPNDKATTASNITSALNDPANGYTGFLTAKTNVDTVVMESVVAGDGSAVVPLTGNYIPLSVVSAGGLVASGPTFIGGADRPNKPTDGQDKLYRHGNVLSPSATWIDDDMVDSVVGAETTQRVQVQYRFRYTNDEDINYKIHPDGFSNTASGTGVPLVIAQGPRSTPALNVGGNTYPFVPADQTGTWLQSSAISYGIKDNGLWVAGSGNAQSVKDLGTLDGYVYAIPLCFVFRHNDAALGFHPSNNSNGAALHDHAPYSGALGVIGSGISDRPDNEFADVISVNNLLDLRRNVVLPGIDYSSELQYQIQSLLDANNRTWAIDSYDKHSYATSDNGDVSTRILNCNAIGRTGVPVPGGNLTRQFDHIARRFGDNPVVERVVFAFWPGDRESGTAVSPGLVSTAKYVEHSGTYDDITKAVWTEGDVLHLDLTKFDTHGLGLFFQGGSMGGPALPGGAQLFTDKMPPGTVISDVLSVYHDDGHYDNTSSHQEVQIAMIGGVGTNHVDITLDGNGTLVTGGLDVAPGGEYPMVDSASPAGDASPRRIFVEFEISYPIGTETYQGLTDTPILDEITPDSTIYDNDTTNPSGDFLSGEGPAIVVDKTQLPADAFYRNPPGFREGFREVRLDYTTDATTDWSTPDTDPVSEAYDPVTNPYGGIVTRNADNLMTPRRIYYPIGSVGSGYPTVYDVPNAASVAVDVDLTEYGSSSRKIVFENSLAGPGCTLCNVEYYPQDPIPNYGDAGYTVMVYYRAASPQTAGSIGGGILGTDPPGGGTLPTTLEVEPLAISAQTWTSQVGMGSVDAAFPYAAPLDQIPVMEGAAFFANSPDIGEWDFCASAMVTVDDFNTDTGMLVLQSMVQSDQQPTWTLGGTDNYAYPRMDKEFRALYPFMTGSDGYRPTIMAQPLFGAARHKVFIPVLARVKETVPGALNGILFRQDELVLLVMTRWAELDEDNHIRFIGGLDSEDGEVDALANRTCVTVYRTRNMLLTMGR